MVSHSFVFRSYSPAFRSPLVIGKVNGLQIPFRFTIQQAIVFLVSIGVGFKSQHVWGVIVPLSGIWAMLVVAGLSAWLAWLIQSKQIEGRHPLAFALGCGKFFALSCVVRLRSADSRSVLLRVERSVQAKVPPKVVVASSKSQLVKPHQHVLSGWEAFTDV